MKTKSKTENRARTGRLVHGEMTIWMCALALVITSAIFTKERGSLPALAQLNATPTAASTQDATDATEAQISAVALRTSIDEDAIANAIEQAAAQASEQANEQASGQAIDQAQAAPELQIEIREAEPVDTSIRWFDGKAVRPVKTIYMTVTGYSPDARSCGKYADNNTATMHSVWTNGMNLVAADPRVLPYWSMISIPGYADGDVVPVLDCGGAIKGNRLDLLYPTHELALQWGIRELPITVWEYVEAE